jgi:PII-like signaling protein
VSYGVFVELRDSMGRPVFVRVDKVVSVGARAATTVKAVIGFGSSEFVGVQENAQQVFDKMREAVLTAEPEEFR